MGERIRIAFDTELQRRRLGVLLRIPIAIPPALALAGWTVLVVAALPLAWMLTAARVELPDPLHRFEARYLLDVTRFAAWLALVSAHERVSLEAPRLLQPRATVVFRPLLALPAIVLGSVLAVALAWAAVAAWFVALARGRTTEGLRELGAFCIRYQAETLAYLMLLTPCYPAVAPQTPQ